MDVYNFKKCLITVSKYGPIDYGDMVEILATVGYENRDSKKIPIEQWVKGSIKYDSDTCSFVVSIDQSVGSLVKGDYIYIDKHSEIRQVSIFNN